MLVTEPSHVRVNCSGFQVGALSWLFPAKNAPAGRTWTQPPRTGVYLRILFRRSRLIFKKHLLPLFYCPCFGSRPSPTKIPAHGIENVELDEFTQMVLAQSLTGITKAQEDFNIGEYVAPGAIGSHSYAKHPRFHREGLVSSTIVDLDIAVPAEDTVTTRGSGGARVRGIGAEGEASATERDLRIKCSLCD